MIIREAVGDKTVGDGFVRPFCYFVQLRNYTVPFCTFSELGGLVASFVVAGVFNNCSRNVAESREIVYICGWRWLGCCIRLTSGSWLWSRAALSGPWGFWGLATGELTL